MPGIYLAVSDWENKLKSTGGNEPHITVGYNKDPLPRAELWGLAMKLGPEWIGQKVYLERAYLSVYEKEVEPKEEEEGPKMVTHYDVLAAVDEKTSEHVMHSRSHLALPESHWIMRDPHISLHRGTDPIKAQQVMEEFVPLVATVSAVTI